MLSLLLAISDNDADRAFIEGLFEAYYPRMRGLAFAVLRDEGAAEDVAQDVILYIFENAGRFRDLDSCTLRHLVDLIIRRRCFNVLKARKVRRKHSAGSLDGDGFGGFADPNEPSVEELALRNIDAERLAEAIRQLPPDQRFAIEAKYILGMNDGEIAKELGIRKNSVRQYLTRARRRAYTILEGLYEQEQ